MLTTCLWSPDMRALDMAECYTSVFRDSRITHIGYYDEANPHLPGSKAGDVMIVEFTLLGNNQFATLNGGPYFKHSCATSWMIPCANQEELSYYYDKLSAKPESEMCGWIEDQFGISWQLIPANYTEYIRNGEKSKVANLNRAIMEMKRLSWEAIENAYTK
jgi:predicted 3-demethylubiquinone-9 3-methyltransferase (glyoxalase superfamily)